MGVAAPNVFRDHSRFLSQCSALAMRNKGLDYVCAADASRDYMVRILATDTLNYVIQGPGLRAYSLCNLGSISGGSFKLSVGRSTSPSEKSLPAAFP